MQQVAAQKTDIAALPFAASSTAQAVEAGIDGKAESQKGNGFDSLYQVAKTQVNQAEPKRTSPSSNTPANTTHSVVREGKDKDAGHTNLPSDEKVSDAPTPTHETEVKAKPASGVLGEDNSESPELAQHNESEDVVQPQDTLEVEGDVVVSHRTETTYILGEGGKKDPDAGVITTPGTPDGKPDKEESGEPDWIAYVETIANRQKDSAADGSSQNNVTSATDLDGVIKVKESGRLWKLPEDVDSESVDSVLAHLLSQLQTAKEQGASDSESLNAVGDELLNTLRTLGDLLRGSNRKDGEPEHNEQQAVQSELTTITDTNVKNEDDLASLIAQLLNTEQTESSQATSTAETRMIEGDSSESLSLTAEEEFILSLIQQAANVDGSETSEGAEGSDSASRLEALLAQATEQAKATDGKQSGGSEIKAGNENNANDVSIGADDAAGSLLNAIAKLPTETAQKATEALADRIVATMPNGAQQQSVKANIIAGINEFQQQVQQGREPGIDLSAIVADAAKEAAVSSDVAASLTARVDSQASQFLQLMNTTQQSVHQVMQGQLAQVDTVMNENNQLRAEASKSQQQFEGFDKAVNIHKPEGQQQLNEKIRWMVNARNTMAEIRLDPPELGSMQVRVNVAGDAASVSFIVQSQQAKEALADAMPKLRDMLQEQGIELGDAQVRKDNSSSGENGQQLANNNDGSSSGRGNRGNNDGMDDEMGGTSVIEQSVTRELKGGIDFYA
ncbi:flagellar hook-length control protein FliK [Alteromonas sp. 009811495]|uniref:flagellar hook-length control protein FliK n=1 Tax=Alteromonas sp. 009811495 TaxID=3002962 RepID=UPI00237DFF84|nr:flagellar hook-length control protein FliK [Alteromonas sp. 009811495]WDT87167.1 flagellar hook-length control protein FliK [Alteromonas sp. 009811495]